MKLLAILLALVPLAALPLANAAPPSVCGSTGDCLADLGLVYGCTVNGGFVRADAPIDGCQPQVWTCAFEGYFGGAGGDNLWRNFEFSCTPVLP